MNDAFPTTLRKRIHWISLPVAGLVWLAYLGFQEPGWFSDRYWIRGAHPALSGILSAIVGYAAALLALLTRNSLSNLTATLFPISLRRLGVAAGLMAITPVMFWGPLPLFPALAVVFFAGITDEAFFALILPAVAVLLSLWYTVLSVLDTQDWMTRSHRIQSTCLIFAGVAAGVFLWLSESYF